VTTIAASTYLYGDQLGAVNVSGLVLVLLGVGMYRQYRLSVSQQAEESGHGHLSGGESKAGVISTSTRLSTTDVDAECELTPLFDSEDEEESGIHVWVENSSSHTELQNSDPILNVDIRLR
jgi:hypothetical protein